MNPVDAIPQKPPFLFVDEVIERTDNHIKTAKNLTGDENFFKGHFPGNPIMPGVLLQEALFQSGAILMAGKGAGLGVVTRVNNAKFKGMVKPGDTLEMEVSLDDTIGNAYYMKGKTKVNGKMVVSLDFACALIESDV